MIGDEISLIPEYDSHMPISRRSFIALSVLPWALKAQASASIPIGLELYSVREALKQDPEGTVRSVAKLGYQCVEFYAPYFEWSESQTKQMRKLLDDLGVQCYSTHNDQKYFSAENINRARDMNLILGCKYMVMASSQPKPRLEGWKAIAEELNSAAEKIELSGLKPAYHNHHLNSLRLTVFVLSKFSRRIRSHRSCCSLTWALALKRDLIRWPGFAPIQDEFIHCI